MGARSAKGTSGEKKPHLGPTWSPRERARPRLARVAGRSAKRFKVRACDHRSPFNNARKERMRADPQNGGRRSMPQTPAYRPSIEPRVNRHRNWALHGGRLWTGQARG